MSNLADRPQFELVPPSRAPNEWMKNFLDLVFLPVETNGGRVEQIRVCQKEFEELKKNVKGEDLDLNVVPELIAAGMVATIFGADVRVSQEHRPGHYEVLYDDLKKKNVVCLRKNETAREDCPDLECLVDIVHDM